jgi:hypothetical protein
LVVAWVSLSPGLALADGGGGTCNGNAWAESGCELIFLFLYSPLIFFLSLLVLIAISIRFVALLRKWRRHQVLEIETYYANLSALTALSGSVTLAIVSTGTIVHLMEEFPKGYKVTLGTMLGTALLYVIHRGGWQEYKRLRAEASLLPPSLAGPHHGAGEPAAGNAVNDPLGKRNL